MWRYVDLKKIFKSICFVLGSVALIGGVFAFKSKSFFASNVTVVNEKNLETFDSVDVNIDSSKINFIPSDNYGLEISTSENTNIPTWSIENKTLKVYRGESKNNFNSKDDLINIYYPKKEFENICIRSNAAFINISDMTLKKLDVYLNVGNINVDFDEGHCEELNFDVSSGKISINGDISKSTLINCMNGNVNFSGDLKGKSDFKVNNGNINIKCKDSDSNYNYYLNTQNGKINVQNRCVGKQFSKISPNNADNNINVYVLNGKINLEFKK